VLAKVKVIYWPMNLHKTHWALLEMNLEEKIWKVYDSLVQSAEGYYLDNVTRVCQQHRIRRIATLIDEFQLLQDFLLGLEGWAPVCEFSG
jgi:Ulp1 family protease